MASKEEKLGITAKKSEDFSEWYNEVVIKSELAEHSVIKGFMVIKPRGYAMWEKIQEFFDKNIKKSAIEEQYADARITLWEVLPMQYYPKNTAFGTFLKRYPDIDPYRLEKMYRKYSDTLAKSSKEVLELYLGINVDYNLQPFNMKQVAEFLKISESAISHPDTIKLLKKAGFNGFLIGENFMKTSNPGKAMEEFVRQI